MYQRTSRSAGVGRFPRPRRTATAVIGAICALVVGACGYSNPPDIGSAREGLPAEYRVEFRGEDGKTVLDLLREHAENVVTEGSGDEILVTAINGIEGGVEGRNWLYYVNEQAAVISAARMNTVDGDAVEWLFVR